MSLSNSSELSSPPTSEDEETDLPSPRLSGLDRYFRPVPKARHIAVSPPPPKRPASPPHEYVLADNPDIATIVMFRSRFHAVFPKSLPHYGPQDIERGVDGAYPGEHVERLLCALLGLVLNRKKDVERGHFQRALEEAVQSHRANWPAVWRGINPLHGGGTFTTMTPDERLTLLKTLALWALSSSDAVQALVKESYKQVRHEDDRNQPLSVQPWGRDGYKRKYWLVEGQDDTHFRLYREANERDSASYQWFSIAGTIDEVRSVADSLDQEGTSHARTLRDRIRAAIPRFESGEEKRRRKDYRLSRKAAFARPDPGFSLYEGRTRGKRMRYTFSDDEDSDGGTASGSIRNSGTSTPLEPPGPIVTTSGRQVKSRYGGVYAGSMPLKERNGTENGTTVSEKLPNGIVNTPNYGNSEPGTDLPRRRGRPRKVVPTTQSSEESSDEEICRGEDEAFSSQEWKETGNEPEGGEDFEEEDLVSDDEDLGHDVNGVSAVGSRDTTCEEDSLVVQLRYKKVGPSMRAPERLDRDLVGSTSAGNPLDHTGLRLQSQGSPSRVEHKNGFQNGNLRKDDPIEMVDVNAQLGTGSSEGYG